MVKNKFLLRLFVAVGMLLSFTAMQAAPTYLVLVFNDDETATFDLGAAPVITHDATNSLTVDGSEATVCVSMKDVVNYHFSNETDAIDEKTMPAGEQMNMNDGQVVVQNLKAGDAINVYGIDGTVRYRGVASADGVASVSLSELGAGVYIVQTPHASYKILVK